MTSETVGTSPAADTGAIEEALRHPASGNMAVAAYLTAGFPSMDGFAEAAAAITPVVDVLEVGVPFTDPMADGKTIQRASEIALEGGVTLESIIGALDDMKLPIPVALMSYLNPLVSYGIERLASNGRAHGIHGLIVPDLPLEESATTRELCDANAIDLIQLVTPMSNNDRIRELCRVSRGFVYAVATTGITGGQTDADGSLLDYIARVKKHSNLPVMAGFGIRSAAQVKSIGSAADGIVVGSALLESVERGDDPRAFIETLVTGSR